MYVEMESEPVSLTVARTRVLVVLVRPLLLLMMVGVVGVVVREAEAAVRPRGACDCS